jgi:hypothetical protein
LEIKSGVVQTCWATRAALIWEPGDDALDLELHLQSLKMSEIGDTLAILTITNIGAVYLNVNLLAKGIENFMFPYSSLAINDTYPLNVSCKLGRNVL